MECSYCEKEAELRCDCGKVFCRDCANHNSTYELGYCPECHDELGDIDWERGEKNMRRCRRGCGFTVRAKTEEKEFIVMKGGFEELGAKQQLEFIKNNPRDACRLIWYYQGMCVRLAKVVK